VIIIIMNTEMFIEQSCFWEPAAELRTHSTTKHVSRYKQIDCTETKSLYLSGLLKIDLTELGTVRLSNRL